MSTRREFLNLALVGGTAAALAPRPAGAAVKSMGVVHESSFIKGFVVEGFWAGFLGAIVYSLISWLLASLVLK